MFLFCSSASKSIHLGHGANSISAVHPRSKKNPWRLRWSHDIARTFGVVSAKCMPWLLILASKLHHATHLASATCPETNLDSFWIWQLACPEALALRPSVEQPSEVKNTLKNGEGFWLFFWIFIFLYFAVLLLKQQKLRNFGRPRRSIEVKDQNPPELIQWNTSQTVQTVISICIRQDVDVIWGFRVPCLPRFVMRCWLYAKTKCLLGLCNFPR